MVEHEDQLFPELSEEEFRIIRDFIYRRSGIYFHDSKKAFLEVKLRQRLAQRRASSFSEYFMHIQQAMDDRETMEVLNRVTTLETCFYRNRPQMEVLAELVLPELAEVKRRVGSSSLRIWSAGCSTGEEAYTLAMVLAAHRELFPPDMRLEVLGTDINTEALAHAERAWYPVSRARALPDSLKARFLAPERDGFKLTKEIRDLVRFQYFNLANGTRFLSMGRMDVVFCRNVLVYFGEAVRRRVLHSLYRTLRDTGFLFTGLTEDISTMTKRFVPMVRSERIVCYRPVGEAADARDLARGGSGGRH